MLDSYGLGVVTSGCGFDELFVGFSWLVSLGVLYGCLLLVIVWF